MGHWLPQTDEKLARERLAQVFRVTARLVLGNGSPKLAELFNQTEVVQLSVCLAHEFYVLGERIHQIFLRVVIIPNWRKNLFFIASFRSATFNLYWSLSIRFIYLSSVKHFSRKEPTYMDPTVGQLNLGPTDFNAPTSYN